MPKIGLFLSPAILPDSLAGYGFMYIAVSVLKRIVPSFDVPCFLLVMKGDGAYALDTAVHT
jgi:hypothetical protein